jgi:hypothetical protein
MICSNTSLVRRAYNTFKIVPWTKTPVLGSLTNGPFINNSSTNLNGNSFGTSNSHNKRLNNEQDVASTEKELKQAQEVEAALVREYGSLDKS